MWDVADVAKHLGMSPWAAKRRLLRLDREHPGLLERSAGKNRRFTVVVARLRECCPELFRPVEDLEGQVEELREEVAELRRFLKIVVSQVGANTRSIEKVKR